MMRIMAWLAGLAALFLAQAAWAGAVGFEQVSIPVSGDKPIVAGIWYPTDAKEKVTPLRMFTQSVAEGASPSVGRHPMIVFSHGTGGWYGEHVDTAHALAEAGFIVAAVSHTGDTFDDRSRVVRITERPGHLVRTIDYMLGEWRAHDQVDPRRIGAFGFSAGGYTVLAAAGGEADLTQLRRHCAEHPHFYDCLMLRLSPTRAPAVPAPAAHDSRLRALVVAAPAMGFAFAPAGLAKVTVPVQLWRAEWDTVLPQPYYAEEVRRLLPRPAEYHVVPKADHFDFLAPCSEALAKDAPEICARTIDRAAFHKTFNAEIVRFFRANLR